MDVIKSVAEAWPKILTAGNPVMPYDSTKQYDFARHGYIPSGVPLIDALYAAWKPVVVYLPAREMGYPNFNHQKNHIELFGPQCYKSAEVYAHSAIHELAHWAGWKGRMERQSILKGHRAEEEVVADLAAALILDKAGALEDNLELVQIYVAHWLTVGYADEAVQKTILFDMFNWGNKEEAKEFPSAEEVFKRAATAAENTASYLLTRVNGDKK